MLNNLIFKSIPYLFLLFFIFFEFSPNYLLQDQLVKPYMFFTVIYTWIYIDHKKFSPFSILVMTVIYDLLNGDMVGITCLFFLFIQYSRRKLFSDLTTYDLKEIWVKFIISLTTYLSITLLIKLFLSILSSFAAMTFSSDLRPLSLENEEATKDFLPRNFALS